MAKWFGKIGYVVTKETEPGIWESEVVEKEYYGDLTSDRRKRQTTNGINDDISLSNTISIVSDQFAFENASYITYVLTMGAKWKVTDVEIQHPRLNLTIGGVYNG